MFARIIEQGRWTYSSARSIERGDTEEPQARRREVEILSHSFYAQTARHTAEREEYFLCLTLACANYN